MSTSTSDAWDLLDTHSVGGYLHERGLISAAPEDCRHLSGGVSNAVLLVQSGARRLVVKQSLPRLRVAADWPAKRERTLTEAAALALMAKLTPGACPTVIDVDDEQCVLVIEAAPEGWETWKSALLRGQVDVEVAGRIGTLLGTWHSKTADMEVPDDPEAFAQLRLHPYHHTCAERHPVLAPRILAAAQSLQTRRQCLVHGDFSPKNILCGTSPDDIWVIDAETAHRGHPVFDVAFMQCHLVLKAFHQPGAAAALAAAARCFLERYAAQGATGASDEAELALQLGCLLLARVDGKSPVEYLDATLAPRIRTLAALLIRDGFGAVGGNLDAVFVSLEQAFALANQSSSQGAPPRCMESRPSGQSPVIGHQSLFPNKAASS